MLEQYKFLLIDIDDTLLDFHKAETQAFEKLVVSCGMEYTAQLQKEYSEYNKQLWEKLERGEISREALLCHRFYNFFIRYGLQVQGEEVDERYRQYLSQGKQVFPGVEDVLKQLFNTHTLYIVTNGIGKTQRARLKNNQLESYFDHLFISEEVGANKPSKSFFDEVLRHNTNMKKEEMLIIGDSFSADIIGGIQAGIDTCWIAPLEKEIPGKIAPTYRVEKFVDIVTIK